MGAEQDLKVAVALYSAFESPAEVQLLDPTYGRIRFSETKWSARTDGSIELKTGELKSHQCSAEELGLSGNSASKFYPINSSS